MPESHALTARKIVEFLQAERVRRGLSHESLAVAAGVSSSCVRHLERGRSTPTLITLLKICEAMDINLADLLRKAQRSRKG